MPRRPAALLTSLATFLTPHSLSFLTTRSKNNPFPFNYFRTLLQKHRGCHQAVSPILQEKHSNSCRKPPLLRSFAPQRSPSPSFSIRCALFLCLPGMESLFDFPRSTVDRYHRKSRRTGTCEKNSPYAVILYGLIPAALPLSHRFSPHFILPPHLLYDIARLIAHPTARRFGGPHGH